MSVLFLFYRHTPENSRPNPPVTTERTNICLGWFVVQACTVSLFASQSAFEPIVYHIHTIHPSMCYFWNSLNTGRDAGQQHP